MSRKQGGTNVTLSPVWSNRALKEKLSVEDARRLADYDYWTFGRPADKGDPGEDPIPLKVSWVYGESNEEFGWYDQDAYKLLQRTHFLVEDKPYKS